MEFDYSRLKGRITEKLGTRSAFAKAMETSENTISKKLGNKTEWTQSEMRKTCAVLDIPEADIPGYFFTLKVQY